MIGQSTTPWIQKAMGRNKAKWLFQCRYLFLCPNGGHLGQAWDDQKVFSMHGVIDLFQTSMPATSRNASHRKDFRQ